MPTQPSSSGRPAAPGRARRCRRSLPPGRAAVPLVCLVQQDRRSAARPACAYPVRRRGRPAGPRGPAVRVPRTDERDPPTPRSGSCTARDRRAATGRQPGADHDAGPGRSRRSAPPMRVAVPNAGAGCPAARRAGPGTRGVAGQLERVQVRSLGDADVLAADRQLGADGPVVHGHAAAVATRHHGSGEVSRPRIPATLSTRGRDRASRWGGLAPSSERFCRGSVDLWVTVL